MLRSNLTPQSKHSTIMVTGWGIAQQSRLAEWGGSESKHDGFQNTNVWLRLVKKGNTVTSYYKYDGDIGYMRYHSVTIDLGPSYFLGLCVTMNDALVLGTLVVSDFAISKDVEWMNVPIKIGNSSSAADEFPDGSVNVGGVPALPGSHLGSGNDWSLSGSVGDIWVRHMFGIFCVGMAQLDLGIGGGGGPSRMTQASIPPTEPRFNPSLSPFQLASCLPLTIIIFLLRDFRVDPISFTTSMPTTPETSPSPARSSPSPAAGRGRRAGSCSVAVSRRNRSTP